MSNIVSSAIFCARNVDKAEEQGKTARWAVAAGQAKKVTDYVTTLDNKVGKTTKTAVESLHKAAKSEKLLEAAGKAVDFASKNINPLICVSSGIDVLTSDDKEAALVTNAAALGSMFTVEKLMKEHMDDLPKMDWLKGITAKVEKFAKANHCEKGLPKIIHGVAFVIGSCTAYSAGENFGKLLLSGRNKAEQPAA